MPELSLYCLVAPVSMNPQISAIARSTFVEGLRTRLLEVTALTVVVILAASAFIHELAVIESARMQIAAYAAAVRFAAVFIAAFHVLSSVAREFNDKGIDVALAVDLPRSHYIVGKLAGYVALVTLVAALAAVPLVALAPPANALLWAVSLVLELAVIAAAAMFCAVTFTHVLPAAGFVLAFYLLARSLTALRLIGEHPISGGGTWPHEFVAGSLKALTLLMPSFDTWTRTVWLLDAAPRWPDVAAIGAQALLYVVLLFGATLVDFYRRNF